MPKQPIYNAVAIKHLIALAIKLYGEKHSGKDRPFYEGLKVFINNKAYKNHPNRAEKVDIPQVGKYTTLRDYHKTANAATTDKEVMNASRRVIDALKLCTGDKSVHPIIKKKAYTADDLEGNWTVLMRNNKDLKGFTTEAKVRKINKQQQVTLSLKGKNYKGIIKKEVAQEIYTATLKSWNTLLQINFNFTQINQNIIFIGSYSGKLPVYNRPPYGEIFLIRKEGVFELLDNKQQLSLPILATVLATNPEKIHSLTDLYHDFNGSVPTTVFVPNTSSVNTTGSIFFKSLNIILGSILLVLGILFFFNTDENNEMITNNETPAKERSNEPPTELSTIGFPEVKNTISPNSPNPILNKQVYETIVDSQLVEQKDSIINSLTTALIQSKSICLSDACINSYFLERQLNQQYKYEDIPKAGTQTSFLKLYEEQKYDTIINALEQRPITTTDALRFLALAKFYTQDFDGANAIFKNTRKPIGSLDDDAIEWFATLNDYILELQKGTFDYNTLQSLKTKFQPIINNNNHPYTKQAAEITKQLDCILARR